MRLCTLKRKFPIQTDRLRISVMSVRDINWYTEEVLKRYFTEYSNNKNILNMPINIIKYRLGKLADSYNSNDEFDREFRLVARKKLDLTVIGGITVFPGYNSNFIELAYWVKPEYQGNGYATEMLQRMSDYILNIFKSIDGVTLAIQDINSKSINVANKCGFKAHDTYVETGYRSIIYIKRR